MAALIMSVGAMSFPRKRRHRGTAATDADCSPSCGDGDDSAVYTGTLAQMGTTGHAIAGLGNFAAGAKHRYQFGVGLDSTADNSYQGDSSTVTFTWNAA